MQQYRNESIERRNRLLAIIARQHGVTSQQLTTLSKIVIEKLPRVDATTIYGHIDRGNRLMTPAYRQLFYALSQLPDGVQFLCALRADLLVIWMDLRCHARIEILRNSPTMLRRRQ